METLSVALGDRSYPIHVGRALLDRADLLLPFLRQGSKGAIVTNTTVAPWYLPRVSDSLRRAGLDVVEIVVPDGERFKNWQTLNAIFDVLLERHCERSTTLIALGGGVGWVWGRRRKYWHCADPECNRLMKAEVRQCPGCGGTIAAEIASARLRLAKEEELDLEAAAAASDAPDDR